MICIKNRTILLPFAVMALLLASVTDVRAQDMKKLAQTGFQFLKIDVGARGSAMGGAYVAVVDDANALFWNPAGISHVEGIDVSLNHTRWFADVGFSSLAASVQLGTGHFVGASILTADYGEIETTIPSSNEAGFVEGGTFRPGAYAVGLTYTRQFSTQFSIGGQVKYAHEDLGTSTVLRPGETQQATVDNALAGLGFDIGTLYYTGFHDLRLSLAIRNFSTELKYEQEAFQMPMTFDLGIAMDVFRATDMSTNHSLTLAVDAIHPRDYTERMHFGAEYTFLQAFSVRSGYKLNYDTEGLTAGLGVKQELSGVDLRIDYGYTDMGAYLGNVHRISLGGSF